MLVARLRIGIAKRRRLLGNQFRIGRADALQHFQDASPHLARLRMAADLVLREDQLAIDRDVKDAAGGRNQFPTADIVFDFAFVQDFVRQTDGIGLVSSSRAVLDDDVHSTLLHDAPPFLVAAVDARMIAQMDGNCKRISRRRLPPDPTGGPRGVKRGDRGG